MVVPYHTHNFEIPTASKNDVLLGVSNDRVVVPSALGSAAVKDVSTFATAEQGKIADKAVKPERKLNAGAGLIGGGDLTTDRTIRLDDAVQASLLKVEDAVQKSDVKALAYQDKVGVADIAVSGVPTKNSYLSGDGWKPFEIAEHTARPSNIAKCDADNVFKGQVSFTGDVCLRGRNKVFKTTGQNSPIYTAGRSSAIFTHDDDSSIYTKGAGSHVVAGLVSEASLAPQDNKVDKKKGQLIGHGEYIYSLLLGSLAYFTTLTPPTGWLRCNGAELNRVSYPELWQHAENSGMIVDEVRWQESDDCKGMFSLGDGATTFRVPLLDDMFLRGSSNNRAIGSFQGDAIRNITGQLKGRAPIAEGTAEGMCQIFPAQAQSLNYLNLRNKYYAILNFDASRVVPTADENRPKNISYPIYIRYI